MKAPRDYTEAELARGAAITALAADLLHVAGEALQRHSRVANQDPLGLAIVSAAFSIAIADIDRSIDNRFARMVFGAIKAQNPGML